MLLLNTLQPRIVQPKGTAVLGREILPLLVITLRHFSLNFYELGTDEDCGVMR
jgi:hypothetical protein